MVEKLQAARAVLLLSLLLFVVAFATHEPLAVLLAYVREPVVRTALGANVLILAFFAIIETIDYLVETLFDADFPILTTPEFNYGVPALIILAAVYLAAARSHH